MIEPTDPNTMYVPYYEPATVYGTWPYAEYPPYYFGYPSYIGAGVVAAGLAFASAAHADKSDIILFKNGDRLTGEVKVLDRGKISFDTDATGVIKVEWDDIEQL